MNKIFKYGFEIKPAKMKIWHVVTATNEDKSIKELEVQITYNPDDTNDNEPHDTTITVQDNEQSVNFALKQLQNAIKTFEKEIMTFFDNQNNIDKYQHISHKGAKNGN
jgi:hypothetical protein